MMASTDSAEAILCFSVCQTVERGVSWRGPAPFDFSNLALYITSKQEVRQDFQLPKNRKLFQRLISGAAKLFSELGIIESLRLPEVVD
jgi:hypothetical protein